MTFLSNFFIGQGSACARGLAMDSERAAHANVCNMKGEKTFLFIKIRKEKSNLLRRNYGCSYYSVVYV